MKEEELKRNYTTIDGLSNKYFKGRRSIERTLVRFQPYNPELIYNDGQKLWIHNSITGEVLNRKYTKYIHKTSYFNHALEQIRKDEKELTVFGTIACKAVEDTKVLKHFMWECMGYYKTLKPSSPVRLLYGIENNTNYFDDNNGWHVHWVSDCTGVDMVQHKKELDEMIIENLSPEDYNLEISCKVEPYDINRGRGGCWYTVKNYISENGFNYINDNKNPLYGILAK